MSESRWVPCEHDGCTCDGYEQGPGRTYPLAVIPETGHVLTYTVDVCGVCLHDPAWHIQGCPRPDTLRE